ncbi:5' nucleotidase, NT5C type [Luteimonas mephitis]|uniref:5' nucleotidase, NT5C type n=1 Tax=Luteimonas mephitis TaxID=83615 RepID=UPI003A8F1D93
MNKDRRTLYIDMDNVLVDFPSAFSLITQQQHADFADRLDEVPGIFSKMRPVPGAIEAFQELSGLFDTYLLSTAPWENPSAWSDKLLWVKEHLGKPAYKRLILSHHKNLNRGDFIIDDRTRNGVDKFDGKHIHFGASEFPDWPSVVAYLREHAT